MSEEMKSSIASFASFAQDTTAGDAFSDPNIRAAEEKIALHKGNIAKIEEEIAKLEASKKASGAGGAVAGGAGVAGKTVDQQIEEKKEELAKQQRLLESAEAIRESAMAYAKEAGALDNVLIKEDIEKVLTDLINSGASEEEIAKKIDELIASMNIGDLSKDIDLINAEITELENKKTTRKFEPFTLEVKDGDKVVRTVTVNSLEELFEYEAEISESIKASEKALEELANEKEDLAAKYASWRGKLKNYNTKAAKSARTKAIGRGEKPLELDEIKAEIEKVDAALGELYVNNINKNAQLRGLKEALVDLKLEKAEATKAPKLTQEEESKLAELSTKLEELKEKEAANAELRAKAEQLKEAILVEVRKKENKETKETKKSRGRFKEAGKTLIEKAKQGLINFKISVWDNGLGYAINYFKTHKLAWIEKEETLVTQVDEDIPKVDAEIVTDEVTMNVPKSEKSSQPLLGSGLPKEETTKAEVPAEPAKVSETPEAKKPENDPMAAFGAGINNDVVAGKTNENGTTKVEVPAEPAKVNETPETKKPENDPMAAFGAGINNDVVAGKTNENGTTKAEVPAEPAKVSETPEAKKPENDPMAAFGAGINNDVVAGKTNVNGTPKAEVSAEPAKVNETPETKKPENDPMTAFATGINNDVVAGKGKLSLPTTGLSNSVLGGDVAAVMMRAQTEMEKVNASELEAASVDNRPKGPSR